MFLEILSELRSELEKNVVLCRRRSKLTNHSKLYLLFCSLTAKRPLKEKLVVWSTVDIEYQSSVQLLQNLGLTRGSSLREAFVPMPISWGLNQWATFDWQRSQLTLKSAITSQLCLYICILCLYLKTYFQYLKIANYNSCSLTQVYPLSFQEIIICLFNL